MMCATDSKQQPLIGECLDMCPNDEILERQKHKLVHCLEAYPETRKQRHMKADPERMVKSFSRSSAGMATAKKENLRPASVLIKTVDYLLSDVISTPEEEYPFHLTYDFIFDRLRAVRQDIVIQQIHGRDKISIFEKMVLFHAYSGYRLSSVEFRFFDPVINRQHFSECLNILMDLYDVEDEILASSKTEPKVVNKITHCFPLRSLFEGAFILHNLSTQSCLLRIRSLPKEVAQDYNVVKAFKIGIDFMDGNFYRVLQSIMPLHIFHRMVICQHIPCIHLYYLRRLNSAYASRQAKISLQYLAGIMCPFEYLSLAEKHVHRILEILDCKMQDRAVSFEKNNEMLTQDLEKDVLYNIPKRKWSLLDRQIRAKKMLHFIEFDNFAVFRA